MTELRVLILEGSAEDAGRIRDGLASLPPGALITTVCSRPEFERSLDERIWDVVLCGDGVPDLDPQSVIRAVRQRKLQAQVLLFSGHLSDGEAAELLSRGVTDYILKDRPARLVSAVLRAAGRLQIREDVAARRLRFAQAINHMVEVIVTQEEPETILETMGSISGEALSVDRTLIYDISFERYVADALSEWLNPGDPDLQPTRGTYPLDIFIGGAMDLQRTHCWLESHAEKVHPALSKDGSGTLLHGTMKIRSLLWWPFAFRDNGFYLLVLNQVNGRRHWQKDELDFIDTVSRFVTMAVVKIRLLHEQRRIGEALSRSEHRYREIFESASDGMVLFDVLSENRLTIAGINPAAREVFAPNIAVSGADLPQESLQVLDSVHPVLHDCLKSGETQFCEQDLHLNGGIRTFQMSIIPVRDGSGSIYRIVTIARDVTERKQWEHITERTNRALRTLSECNQAVVHSSTEEDLLERICTVLVDISGYPHVLIFLNDQEESLRLVVQRGFEGVDSCDESLLLARQHALASIKAEGECLFQAHLPATPFSESGQQSCIALPLVHASMRLGAIALCAPGPEAFLAPEVRLLRELAGDLAFGIRTLRVRKERDEARREREHYISRISENFEDAIQAIATTLEYRDPYTAGHQRRVAALAAAIGRELGLPEDQVHGLHLVGTVHDLGKIRIPSEILSKPGALNELEHEIVKLHSGAAYEILKGIKFPWPIAQAVYQHHERMDGSGYPRGLKGEEILLEARILAVADIVEAMSSHRPYRAGLGLESAFAEIISRRGEYYDPQVVDACLAVFKGSFEFPPL